MGLDGNISLQLEIKAPADQFYSVFRRQMHLLPEICSDHVHSGEVHEGDWETVGSIRQWTYNLDGCKMTLKGTVEEVDEEKKSVTFKAIEGEVMNKYKMFRPKLEVIPKEPDGCCLVKWTYYYEIVNEDVELPVAYLNLAFKLTKNVDAHLLGSNDRLV